MKIGYLVRLRNYGWDAEPDEYEYPWELRTENPGEYGSYDVKTIVWDYVDDGTID